MLAGQLEIADGILEYEIAGEKACITGFREGKPQAASTQIVLPPQIEGCKVTAIGRKAFLSRKNLQSIVLPDTVGEIGDWAFAHCGGLSRVSLPKKRIRFGKAVFKECTGLKRIELEGPEGDGADLPDVPELLAAAVRELDAYYLLDLTEAGGRDWLEKWDMRLLEVLRSPDQEGYFKQAVWGEEDYVGMDLEVFAENRRKMKAELAFLRLLHPLGLQNPMREELDRFLASMTKGQAGEEAWLVVKEHGSERDYYGLFAELPCINEDNYGEILADIGEGYPEMKAYFLKIKEKKLGTVDFFAGLEL